VTDLAPSHPQSLRSVLRGLQAALDDAAAAHFAHRREHGCREGSGCEAGRLLSERVAEAQGQIGMVRFLNEDG
jgi:hypothetical protein